MGRRIFIVASFFLLFTKSYAQWASYNVMDLSEPWPGSSNIAIACATIDGGIITAGYEQEQFYRPAIIKYFANGAIEWSCRFPEFIAPQTINSLIQTYDLGYALCGDTYYIETAPGNYVASGNFVMKLDSKGNVQWIKKLGGDVTDSKKSIRQARDGGYVLAGTMKGGGYFDACVCKLDHQGNIEWLKTYGGGDNDGFNDIRITKDGGYIAVGYCTNLTTNKKQDYWAVKLSSEGDIEWQNAYDNSASATLVQILDDGGFIILGANSWLIRIGATGEIIWQKSFSGSAAQLKVIDKSIILATEVTKKNETGDDVAFIELSTLDLNGYCEKLREIDFPGSYIAGAGPNFEANALVENGFGGYYLAGRIFFGSYVICSYYLDNMCDGKYITPSQGSNTNATIESTHVISLLREIPCTDINISPVNFAKAIKYRCGGDAFGEFMVSPKNLGFGADTSGNRTSSQRFAIENTSAVIVDWAITTNASWIAVDKNKGIGSTTVDVSIDPSGLGIGQHTGIIYVSSLNAGHAPQLVEIKLSIFQGGSSSPPFGYFDTPVDYSNAAGSIPVTGWALDDIETADVKIWRDPVENEGNSQVFIGDAIFVSGARPDVEQIYSEYPLKSRAGWGYMLLTNALPNHGNGTFKLNASATDKEGNTVILGTKTITGINSIAVKPFGSIDTPTPGGDASGNPYLNFGWVLTPLPKTVPKDGSTISVYVDSILQGRLNTPPNVFNQFRIDVSTFFPGLNNSSGPVGAFFLDTTKFANGIHTIHWIAFDDQGHVEGIGSRYFNIVNTAGNSVQSGNGPVYSFAKFASLRMAEDILSLPNHNTSIKVKTGIDLKASRRQISPDPRGFYHIEIPEVNGVEIVLEDDDDRGISLMARHQFIGYLLVGEELRPLPIGSYLDADSGIFSWMPGPGFLGTYELIFLKRDSMAMRRISVQVTIRPKY